MSPEAAHFHQLEYSEHSYPANGHLVGGQGAGLVRADDGGAAEGLHRGQRAYDGVLLGHATGTQSQAGGDDGGQAFGDGGHSQCDSDLEVVHGPADPRAAVNGIVEVSDVDEPHSDADERDDLGELLAELVQFLLQWRALLLRGYHLVTDFANFGVHTCGDHYAYCFACSDVGTL